MNSQHTDDDLWNYLFGLCSDDKHRIIQLDLQDRSSETSKRLNSLSKSLADPYRIPAITFAAQARIRDESSAPLLADFVEILNSSLSSDESRRQAENWIAHQLDWLLRLRQRHFPQQPLSKRNAVDAIADQFGDISLSRELERQFLCLAAATLRRRTFQSASQLTKPVTKSDAIDTLAMAGEETIEVFASDEETVRDIPVPKRILAREDALKKLELHGEDDSMTELYMLQFFAGRKVDEIALLRDEPEVSITAQLDAVTRFVEHSIAESLS